MPNAVHYIAIYDETRDYPVVGRVLLCEPIVELRLLAGADASDDLLGSYPLSGKRLAKMSAKYDFLVLPHRTYFLESERD